MMATIADISLSNYVLLAIVSGSIIVLVLIVSIISTTRRFNYDGKHVVVTGGSSGIGLELAKEYRRLGSRVTIVARDKVRLQSALDELLKVIPNKEETDVKVKVMAISIDTSSSQQEANRGFEKCIEDFGTVDVIVNCAGTSIAGEFENLDEKEFERMLRINVLGSIYPTRAVLAGMKASGSGRIVFVSSQVAQVAIHGYTAYGASKWALRGLAEALQMEVKPYGIFVSVAYPPDTDTPGYKTEMETKPSLTKRISESGQVFKADAVARDIIFYSSRGYFGISTGFDGWLLKQLHPGMSPINSFAELWQQVLAAPLARIISIFYLLAWDAEVAKEVREQKKKS